MLSEINKQYKDYLKLWFSLMKEVLSNDLIKYNDKNYVYKEWRINSVIWEKEIIKNIIQDKNKYKKLCFTEECKKDFSNWNRWYDYYEYLNIPWLYIIIPTEVKSRHWFDISISYNWFFFPINIKISTWNNKDNLFWIMALKYILLWHDFDWWYWVKNVFKIQSENVLAKTIVSFVDTEKKIYKDFHNDFKLYELRDYFFCTINKDTNKISFSSFLTLPKDIISINPKNMFQANLDLLWNDYITENNLDFKKNIENLIKLFFDYTYKKAQPFLILKEIF